MADTGFLFPGTAVGNRTISGSTDDWTGPDNIKADDSSDATAAIDTTSDISAGLAASNFDFSSIPSGSVINGIEIRVGDYDEGSAGDGDFTTLKLILADDSDGSVSKHADLTPPGGTTDVTDEAGGASDLWSETIGLSDVQDVDWGFFVGVSESAGSPFFDIDYLQMKVYFTPKPEITDVNTTESWDNGDSGLVITGTDFV